jgi:hypothetical protein
MARNPAISRLGQRLVLQRPPSTGSGRFPSWSRLSVGGLGAYGRGAGRHLRARHGQAVLGCDSRSDHRLRHAGSRKRRHHRPGAGRRPNLDLLAQRKLDLLVEPAEIERRRAAYVAPEPRVKRRLSQVLCRSRDPGVGRRRAAALTARSFIPEGVPMVETLGTKPEWLTFDCYGTLVQWDEGLIAAVERILNKQNMAVDPTKVHRSVRPARARARG